VNREGPEPIDAVAGRMATVIGRTRRANLDAAWELGACFEGALSGADEHRRSRVAKELRRALADRGCDVGLSTLYAYRHVHRAFARERLPELAEDGLTLSHVTILAALDEPLRAAVWSRLEDDGIPPVRDFRALVAGGRWCCATPRESRRRRTRRRRRGSPRRVHRPRRPEGPRTMVRLRRRSARPLARPVLPAS